MTKDDIKQLTDLRSHMLGVYNALNAKNEPTGVIKQSEVAWEFEVAIKNLDKVLKNYVKFS